MQRRFRISFAAHRATRHDGLLVIKYTQERSGSTTMLKHTHSVIILVLCFTAHLAAFRIVTHHQHH